MTFYRDAEIVGHVPYNLAPRALTFLMRENKAFAEFTEPKSTGELAMGSPMGYDIYLSYILPGHCTLMAIVCALVASQ